MAMASPMVTCSMTSCVQSSYSELTTYFHYTIQYDRRV